MKSSITGLRQSMAGVADFINFAANMEKIRTQPSAAPCLHEVASYLSASSWHQHTYSFCIVSIYGAHERFIRDFCSDVALILGKIYESYSRLPEKMRLSHEKLSIERARDVLERRFGNHHDFQQWVSNLNSCFDDGMSLNSEVFSSSSSNYRSHVVKDVIGRMGIDLSAVDENVNLKSIVVTELNGLYSNINDVVDDLANRRNEIAHGSDCEILDLGTLGSILKVIFGYNYWLYIKISRVLLEILVKERSKEIAVISKTFNNKYAGIRSIGSIDSVCDEIRVGDFLYCVTDKTFSEAIVGSIEHNRNNIYVAAPGNGPFGIDFGIEVRDSACVKKLPAKFSGLARTIRTAMNEKAYCFTGAGFSS
jgi:hypothetical protein